MQKTKRRIESRNTLAPLAASPAGTVTLGSGLDIAANVDVIQMKHGTTVFQKHQRSMRGGTSGRASAQLLHSSHRLCAREQFAVWVLLEIGTRASGALSGIRACM